MPTICQHSGQTEGAIVDALRQAGALAISIIAEKDGAIVGHLGFSPVLIDGQDIGRFGLGPVSVTPTLQRSGTGSAVIEEGLRFLGDRGALGAVVLGDPNYYRRFGFTSDHHLRYADASPNIFSRSRCRVSPQKGMVTYHEGFKAE